MPGESPQRKLVSRLRQKTEDLKRQEELRRYRSPGFTRWREEVKSILKLLYGEGHEKISTFESSTRVYGPESIFDTEAQKEAKRQARWAERLPHLEAFLDATISELDMLEEFTQNTKAKHPLGFRAPHKDEAS